MLELAASGARVLQSRSVEYARRYGVRLHVRSSFDDGPGTWVQNVSHDGATDLSFTVPLAELPRLGSVMERVMKEVGAARYSIDDGVAKVSLIGAGMRTHPGVAADMFDTLATEGINIEMISTSSIRI